MSDLQKINILSKNKLDSLDTTQYPNQLFGTTDDTEDNAISFAESERQKSKNLFFVKTATVTSNGMTYSANAEAQTITLTGTTDYAYFRQPASGRVALEAGKTYTISVDFTSTQGILTYVHFTDGTFETLTVVHGANQVPYVPDTPKEIMAIAIEMYGKTFNNDILRVQVEEGSVATEWQYPYGPIVHENAVSGLRGFVLWENPNPTSSFSSQTLTLSSADYDYLELYYRFDTTHNIVSTMKTVKGYECRMFMMAGTSSGVEVYYRDLIRYTDTSFRISTCFKAVATTESESNANIIPIKIVGYKG